MNCAGFRVLNQKTGRTRTRGVNRIVQRRECPADPADLLALDRDHPIADGKTGDLYLPDVAKSTAAEKVSVQSQAQNKEDK